MTDVPSYFRAYLRNIQPTKENRARAIQIHTTLRGRLAADEDFQDWFDGTFLYGSYRRNTAVQPIKDVDVCVLLDIDPYIDEHRPKAVIDQLRRVLERNGYKDKTAVQRRSVRIDLSQATLDVVPVVAINGEDEPLLIPDRKLTQWVLTHPKGHLKAATELNKQAAKRYIPFVKIVKAWFRFQMTGTERPKPKGFTLEAMVAQYGDLDAPTYAEAFVAFLEQLDHNAGTSLSLGYFPRVEDPGIAGQEVKLTISSDEAKAFGELVRPTLKAARAARAEEDLAASVWAWREIFGPCFPEPKVAARTVEADVQKSRDDEYESGDLDEDIAEVDLPEAPVVLPLKLTAKIAASRGGVTGRFYPSGGKALAKGLWLSFAIERPPVAPPYDTRWTVENHGREAQGARDMGHQAFGGNQRWETTSYRGSHFMICDVLKDGHVVASGRHVVNIN